VASCSGGDRSEQSDTSSSGSVAVTSVSPTDPQTIPGPPPLHEVPLQQAEYLPCNTAAGTEPIEVWISLDALFTEPLEAELAEFTSATGIEVELVTVAKEFEMLERLAQLESDEWPDAVFAHEFMGRALADTNRLVRPGDCDPNFSTRFVPAAVATNTVDSHLASAPLWMSTPVVYYDSNKIEGVAAARLSTASLDDVLIWAEQSVASGLSNSGLALGSGCGELVGQHLLTKFGDLIEPDNGRAARGGRFVLGSAEIAELVADLTKLRVGVDGGSVLALPSDSTGFNALLAISDRELAAALAIHTSTSIDPVVTAVSTAYPWVDAQIVPFADGPVGTTSLWMFGSPGVGNESPAWPLVDWLTQPDRAALVAAATGLSPTVLGAADEPTLAERWAAEPRLRLAYDSIVAKEADYSSATYLVGPWVQVRSAWSRLCEAVVGGKADLQDSVQSMVDEVNNALDAYDMARVQWNTEETVELELSVSCDNGDTVAGVWIQAALSSSGFAQRGSDRVFRYSLQFGGPFVAHVGCGEDEGRWLAVSWSPVLAGASGEIVCVSNPSTYPAGCRLRSG
jgi:ABC-type glycerol-3-phosphate transport system substrate-binding protein